MRTTMRSLVAAAAVLGMSAFGVGAAHAHSDGKGSDKTIVHVEEYEYEFEVGYAHVPMANVEDSKFVYIDQSATNVNFGDLELD